MNHSLEKIDKYTWFTKDRKFAILKCFGLKKYYISKLTMNPDEKTIWKTERFIEDDFNSWKEARSYLIHQIYGGVTMKKHIIWDYDLSNYDRDEMRGVYEECYEETPSDELLEEYIQDTNDDYLDDIRSEIGYYEEDCGKKTYIITGVLGLWYGRREGGKIVEGLWTALRECFEDYNKIYEEKGRLKVIAHHHDGTNYFQIKELTERGEQYVSNHKWDMSDWELHKKLFDDSHYSRNVRLFKEIYGW